MKRRDLLAVGASLLAGAIPAWPQAARKHKVAFVREFGRKPPEPFVGLWQAAFARQGLVEGRNFELVFPGPWDNDLERKRASIRKAVADGADLLLTNGTSDTQAARQAATRIPIVFFNVADPISAGFAKTLAKPGGNMTGVAVHNLTLYPKRLQLIRELMPRAERVALIVDGAFVREGFPPGFYAELHAVAKALRLELIEVDLEHMQEGLEDAFRVAARKRADIVLPLGPFPSNGAFRFTLTQGQSRYRVPVMYGLPARIGITQEVFVTYGASFEEMLDLTTELVAQVLRGADAGEIPVRQMTRIELVLNLRVAREFGIAVPKDVLKRADRVIE